MTAPSGHAHNWVDGTTAITAAKLNEDEADIANVITAHNTLVATTANKADTAYVRRRVLTPIAERAIGSRNTTPVTNTVSTVGTSRFVYPVLAPVSYVRIMFTNFGLNGSSADVAPAGPITIKAAIEDGSALIPLAYNGQSSITIGSGYILTDPVILDRYPGDTIAVRTFLQTVTGGSVLASAVTIPGNGEGFTATTDLTASGSGAVATTFAFNYGPAAVLGNNDPWGVVVGISGDSIAYGQGDSLNAGRNAGAIFRAAVSAGLPLVQCATAGELVGNVLPGGAYSFRGALLATASHVVCDYGRNDVTYQSPATTIETNLVSWWRRWRKTARWVAQTTTTPRTTSTDAWATTTNQTVAASADETIRLAVNAWLRDGAPIDGTSFAVLTTGTASGSAIRTGSANHPLSVLFEVADVVETSRNSGIWKAGYTDDGLHPNGTSYPLMAAVINLSGLT